MNMSKGCEMPPPGYKVARIDVGDSSGLVARPFPPGRVTPSG